MTPEIFDHAAERILPVLSSQADTLNRLRALCLDGPRPVVTVVGKYNHGKSRLLNELIGHAVFAVADRRQTVALQELADADVRWLDAPGLDADVAGGDDSHAQEAAWRHADIRLFVHAAKEGELDAGELALLRVLNSDEALTRRQTIFLLTQVDQAANAAQLEEVTSAIAAQLAGFASIPTVHAVSASRYRQGVDGGKRMLIERSGIPAVKAVLADALRRVPEARAHETAVRLADLHQGLQRRQTGHVDELRRLRDLQRQQLEDFDSGLTGVFGKVQIDLAPVLEVAGIDPSLVPDSFQDMFKLTAGKVDRSRVQVAYSRACIAINAHLVRHGVVGLPETQRTSVAGLDTVMVAVMGVSVKFRDDLRRMFFADAGRERLAKEFRRYFELSDERRALSRQIAERAAAADIGTRAIEAADSVSCLFPLPPA